MKYKSTDIAEEYLRNATSGAKKISYLRDRGPKIVGKIDDFIRKQRSLDPEISDLVDKNFWDLV